MTEPCQLCGCEIACTFHHLIPRTLHSNKWFKKRFTREELRSGIDVCKQCQNAIHHLVPDEKELGRYYNTLDRLLAHPEVSKYVAWKRKRGRRKASADGGR
jgi:hypothetical protein